MPDRVVLLYNPASGRGKAERFAGALTEALHRDGWSADSCPVGPGATTPGFEGAHAVVIIGGDGTAHHAAPALAAAGVPAIIAPMGTENLLAKELGMHAEIPSILRTLREGKPERIDLPTVNGASFLVMCSMGLDATIVAEVGRSRQGRITKATYFAPTIREALHPTIPALRISVDGETICDGERGMLVVANCRRYAVGLNPARDALMRDGLLDIAFMPMRHTLDGIAWAARCWLGIQKNSPGFIGARGRAIVVEQVDGGSAPVQCDGEPAPQGVKAPLRFVADAGTLLVLSAPPQAGE